MSTTRRVGSNFLGWGVALATALALGPIAALFGDPPVTPECEGYCTGNPAPSCPPLSRCVPCCCKQANGTYACVCTPTADCVESNNNSCGACETGI